ncbi:REP-associated tyrosine transposase [Ottowia beijingensis]|uniref:REP-associated tyrosine transposase n=1 Tax=Ottowia beijingensis TaxID=1207057 RepID=UPI002FD8FE47
MFADFGLARLTIGELQKCDALRRCQTLAYVLMPDHLHWLLRLEHGTLSQAVGQFKASSARAVQQARGYAGQALWQAGFHDHALRRDEDLRAAARYLVANPVRAGLVARAGDYSHWDAIWV